MREVPLLLSLLLAACTLQAPSSVSSDEQQLLELHQAGLTAHLAGDIDALLAGQADDFVLANRGEVSSPSKNSDGTYSDLTSPPPHLSFIGHDPANSQDLT